MAPIAPVVKVKALRSSNYSSITKNPRSAKIGGDSRTHAPPAGGGDDDVETDDRTGATSVRHRLYTPWDQRGKPVLLSFGRQEAGAIPE